MSKVLEIAEGDYAYTHDLPVEYETPEDAKRRRNRNASRKHQAVESARLAGVPLYPAVCDTGGEEFDPAQPMIKMLTVADGDYRYEHELPVEFETREDARLRRKRNSHRKYLAVKSARLVGVPQYDMPRDSDGHEFDLAQPMSKMLTVAKGDPVKPGLGPLPGGPECGTVLPPPEDFWDRVADRLAARLVSLVRQASLL